MRTNPTVLKNSSYSIRHNSVLDQVLSHTKNFYNKINDNENKNDNTKFKKIHFKPLSTNTLPPTKIHQL